MQIAICFSQINTKLIQVEYYFSMGVKHISTYRTALHYIPLESLFSETFEVQILLSTQSIFRIEHSFAHFLNHFLIK